MCIWCNGWWECDGEGGECGALPDPVCKAVETQTGWKVDCRVTLKDANEKDVRDSNGDPIEIHVVASVQPPGPNGLKVAINGKEIEDDDGAPRPKMPYQPDKQGRNRDRTWAVNCRHELTREDDGSVVLGQDGKPVEIRVQGYPYHFHPPYHSGGTGHVTHGWGPKVRVMAVPEPTADADEQGDPGEV